MSIAKYVLPVVAGTMSGGILIELAEKGLHNIYPLPPGLDVSDKAALAAAINGMPVSAFVLLMAIYAVSSLAGGAIATAIVGRKQVRPAVVVGIILTVTGILNVVKVPHPLWFSVLSQLCYLPFAYIGFLIMRSKKEERTGL